MMKRILQTILLCAGFCACTQTAEREQPKAAAPVLVSTSPENGASDIETGTISVVFTYDQNVKCSLVNLDRITVSGGATIVKKNCYGATMTVDLEGLEYETTYCVTLPQGCIEGYKDNQEAAVQASVSFTTMAKPVVPHGDGPLQPGTDEAGWENAAQCAASMGPGWSLGNSLDANGSWISGGVENWEKAWGQPVTKKALIQMFADAGFKAIRVPVTWNEHMDTEGNVDEAWMARVQEVVNYVIDCGMYCILNVHHDTGADSDSFKAWLHADESVYTSVKDRYRKLWDQIARRFGSYSEKLVFEAFNEMLDKGNHWDNPSNDASYDVINKFNADFVEVVRSTGGNNARRNLILAVYGASTSEKTLKAFVRPTDSVQDHLLVEVHNYGPYNFAMNEGTGAITEFTAACEKEIDTMFERLNSCIVEYGLPVVMGEYGVTASRAESEAIKQAQCYIRNGRKYNIPCFTWMMLSDGSDRDVPQWTKAKLKDAIIKAYK